MAGILKIDNSKVVGAEAVDLRNLSLIFPLSATTLTSTQTACTLTMPLHSGNWIALFFDLDYTVTLAAATTLTTTVTVTATSNYDPSVTRIVYSKTGPSIASALIGEISLMTLDEPTFYLCTDTNTVTYTVNITLTGTGLTGPAVLSYNTTGAKMFLVEELQLDKAIILPSVTP